MAPTLPTHGDDKKPPKRDKKPPAEAEGLPVPPDGKRKKPSAKSPDRAKKKGRKSSSSDKATSQQQQQRTTPSPKKKPPPFQRTWTCNDEVRILEAMVAYRQEHGALPSPAALFAVLDGLLDRKRLSCRKLADKMRSLMRRHARDAKNGAPTGAHELRLYQLSKNVWVTTPEPSAPSNSNLKSGGGPTQGVPNAGKTFDKMREKYPYLAQAVMLLVDAKAEPAALERLLTVVDDSKALALDLKVCALRKELTEAIMESARIQSTEIWQCPSTRLEPEKVEAVTENNIQLEPLDRMEGTQEKLAQMERQILELRQIVLASPYWPKAENKQHQENSSAKGIRCESAESGLQSNAAENQISCNKMRMNVEAQMKLPSGTIEEVTSKHRYPRNLEIEKMMYGPKKRPYGRIKNDAGSQNKCKLEVKRIALHGQEEHRNTGGKEVLLLSTSWPHVPVAKATVQTSSGSTIVGGMPLGSECYHVFVTDVLKAEAPLLRPPGMKMIDALKSFIAWPRAQIRWCNTGDPVKSDLASHPGH